MLEYATTTTTVAEFSGERRRATNNRYKRTRKYWEGRARVCTNITTQYRSSQFLSWWEIKICVTSDRMETPEKDPLSFL